MLLVKYGYYKHKEHTEWIGILFKQMPISNVRYIKQYFLWWKVQGLERTGRHRYDVEERTINMLKRKVNFLEKKILEIAEGRPEVFDKDEYDIICVITPLKM